MCVCSAALIYGSVNISTYCDTIAYDQTCWSLNACVGKCKLPSEDKEKKGKRLRHLIPERAWHVGYCFLTSEHTFVCYLYTQTWTS